MEKDDELLKLRSELAEHYSVDRELGRGGMATVYLAEDRKHDRKVAIKVLKPEIAAVSGSERFLHEIKVTARLSHPHILPLLDSGKANGLPYYVMPYVEGESLHDRIRREKQLPIKESIQIAREVADALGAAHSLGVVHRDIKPANILLEAGHAVVSDFGIATAISEAGGEKLTETGIAIGTPSYMSPEQATGEKGIDGRSDIYSLGCVLYEMLAGETPFTGPSAQAIIAKQLSLPVPPIATIRETIPAALDRVLRRALAKVPADRFQTAADFVAAVEAAGEASASTSGGVARRVPPRAAWLTLGGAAAAVAFIVVVSGIPGLKGNAGNSRDTTRYAVLPFEYQPGAPESVNEVQRLQDAISRWSGLTVALQGADQTAGRVVRGTVSRVDSTTRVQAALYDAGEDALLADHAIRFPADLAGADSLFAELADRLLFRGPLPEDGPALMGTRSLPARQAFNRGQRLLQDWNLEAADSAFAGAITFDPNYAQAQLWLALVWNWGGAARASWSVAAEQAALGRDNLSPREQAIGDAVLAEARGNLGDACPLWERATEREPPDFAAWYGLAQCLVNDVLVVPDQRSASGWSFRTSYHHALNAYRRAFELRPSILSGFRDRSYESLRNFFMTGTESRGGFTLPPDTTTFVAEPTWQADTLALVPYPLREVQLTRPSRELEEAARHLREQFRDVALAWIASSSGSGNAMEALAISLALLGDPGALDTLRRARTMVDDPQERFRITAAEVWMQLAFALPWDEDGMSRARALADSLLASNSTDPAADPSLLAGLNALTGRAVRAAEFARAPRAADATGVPATMRQTAPALLVYAAFGGPEDSLTALVERVRTAIEETLLPSQREIARLGWLARPATLAFSAYRFDGFEEFFDSGDYLLDIQVHWAAGDTIAVRRGLEQVRTARQNLLPATLPLDALYPEAALLVALGDLEGAAAWLDPTLRALPQAAPHVLASPVRAASLVPTLALRATIADRLGDNEGARRWATAAVTLWSDADQFLQPLVQQLRRLAM